MKKKLICILLGIVFIFCSSISFMGCSKNKEYEYAKERIETRTGIAIPQDIETVYHFYKYGFQDYVQYTYYKFENTPTDWLNENSFMEEKKEEFERDFHSFWSGWHWSPVPEEYQPNFENNYCPVRKGNDFLIYFPDELVLIVFLTGF